MGCEGHLMPKPAVKQLEIASRIRREIVSGAWRPRHRLPTRMQLQREHRASPDTVQRALDRLTQDGFVRNEAGQGSFVANHPPHLHRFGVVFPHRPTPQVPWSRFHEALSHEITRLQHTGERQVVVHYDVIGHVDTDGDLQRLINSVNSHCLTGLLFVSPPVRLQETPVVTDPFVLRMGVMESITQIPGVRPLYLDWNLFIDKSLSHLAARGRRRVAILHSGIPATAQAHFRSVVKSFGMETGEHWIHHLGLGSAGSVSRLILRGSDRPDALIVADDHLVQNVTEAALASGVRAGDDLDIVAHCNWPLPPRVGVPVTLLGFDARRILNTAFDQIDTLRRGEPVTTQLVPPVFENEYLNTNQSAAALRPAVLLDSVSH